MFDWLTLAQADTQHGLGAWVVLLQTIGVTTAILLFMGLCLWKAAPWVGEHAVRPLVARYTALIDALTAGVTQQQQVTAQIGDALEAVARSQERISAGLVELLAHLKEVLQRLEKPPKGE